MITSVTTREWQNRITEQAPEDRITRDQVARIIDNVRERGDRALLDYARQFDQFVGESFWVRQNELQESQLAPELVEASLQARNNITQFCEAQKTKPFEFELRPGHRIGQVVRPLDRVACYVPGGKFPLLSTLMMCVTPAQVAGVREIYVTTPKRSLGIFGMANLCGIDHLTLLGGAHAIAAFAVGTESIPKVDRIVGPGNRFVAEAKKQLSGEVAIDFVAGPTEVCIVANEGNPAWIAADMIAQAEHDTDARSVFMSCNRELAAAVAEQLDKQLQIFPNRTVAEKSLQKNGAIVIGASLEEIFELVNDWAPEHLCLYDPEWLPAVDSAGSIFLGGFSPEAAGDYVTGPNHVLPTAGWARSTGGLSVNHFLKVITTQCLSNDALQSLQAAATTLARAEGLEGHARSVEVRG